MTATATTVRPTPNMMPTQKPATAKARTPRVVVPLRNNQLREGLVQWAKANGIQLS